MRLNLRARFNVGFTGTFRYFFGAIRAAHIGAETGER
jgi:hypothetical protein